MVLQNNMSAEAFLTLAEQHPDKRFDFVDGEMVEVSPKPVHGRIQAQIAFALVTYTSNHPIGIIYTKTLHVLGDKKFIPDIAINHASEADYLTEPPLLAVEIRSDTQSRESQRRKARDYLAQGTGLIWLVFPKEQIEIYQPGRDVIVLTAADVIDGGDVLPGLTLPVRDILG